MDLEQGKSTHMFGYPVKHFSYAELSNSKYGEDICEDEEYGKLKITGQLIAFTEIKEKYLAGPKVLQEEFPLFIPLRHPNVANLVGFTFYVRSFYTVSEFAPLGTLQSRLHRSRSLPPLSWNQRMKIALGAAKGLSYLHEAKPPVVYRDLRPSQILLYEGFNPKLSGYWLTKLAPGYDWFSCQGYCAPEYMETGELTASSNVYNFGCVLMELITGQEGLFEELVREKEVLVRDWSHPMLVTQKDCEAVADPRLRGRFPTTDFCRVVQLAIACLEYDPEERPDVTELVRVLTYLASQRSPNCFSSFFKQCFESSKVFSRK